MTIRTYAAYTVSGAYKTHIPWTAIHVETGLKLSPELILVLLSGDEELPQSLSIVDEQLNVEDVCAVPVWLAC